MIDPNCRILFQPDGLPVHILIPIECGLTVEQIALKDVPAGLPFWLVDVNDLPEDRTYRSAWVLDLEAMGEPHGIGSRP